jgi:sugar (pentulose or hexulose) kinase
MGTHLGLDIGSSSVIAGILQGSRVVAVAPRVFFRTKYTTHTAEVDPDELLLAIGKAVASLGGKRVAWMRWRWPRCVPLGWPWTPEAGR